MDEEVVMRNLVRCGLIGCAALFTACAMQKSDVAVPPPAASAPPQVIEGMPPPPGGTIGTTKLTATAIVEKIDHKTRAVTLKRTDGTSFTFTVDPSVRNLDQVKKGDEVTVTYYESLAYQIKKPGESDPGAAVAEDVRRAQPGEKPAGSVARVQKVTATIKVIDKVAGTVTLVGPEGEAMTVKARDPKNLDRVSVGDLVELTYTEALAIQVDKPTKK
jgi:hypothetical protein